MTKNIMNKILIGVVAVVMISCNTGSISNNNDSVTDAVGSVSTDYHVWSLKQVDFTLSETVCRWEVTPKMYSTYIQMTEGVYIIDNKGKKYDMISYDGISMTPQQDTILGIRTIDFTVTFPAVDTGVTSITYYSSPSFQIRDIPVVKNEMPSFENTAQ